MWKNLKIWARLIIMGGILVTGMLLVVWLSTRSLRQLTDNALETLEESVRQNFDESIKCQVENVITMLDTIYGKYEAGEYSMEEAQLLSAGLVRDMRYKEGGYFWIDDLDGNNIVLLGGETEGTNRYHNQDAYGNNYMQDIINNGKAGGGYSDYYFPREGETEASPKRAYSQIFAPYGWVIGTGNYTDDIDIMVEARRTAMQEQFQDMQNRIYAIVGICLILALAVSAATITGVAAGFRDIIKGLKALAEGNFAYVFPAKYGRRRDEFGILIQEAGTMEKSVAALVGKVKEQSEGIYRLIGNVNGNMESLSEAIENISATTQELAAGMEETSASSEEMSASAQLAGEASSKMAQLSLGGMQEAKEIGRRGAGAKESVSEAQERASRLMEGIDRKLSGALEEVKVIDQIGVLAEAIMSITAQTNMLSLNASIEAARAGEAGKGFAVVAQQIGKLAEQSRSTVSRIQEITQEVTEAVQNLSDSAGELQRFVGADVHEDYGRFLEAGEQYSLDGDLVSTMVSGIHQDADALSNMLENISDIVKNVALAAQEGAAGTSDIAERNTQIRTGAEEIVQMMRQANEIVELLGQEVAKFKVA